MFVNNQTTYLRREILSEVAKVFFEGDLNEINRLPFQVIPSNSQPIRCCIEKDRYLVKERAVAAMGFDIEDEDKIDRSLLSDFAREAMERSQIQEPILTFMNEACKSCVRVNYYVTEVCRNCVAKPCMMNCPKKAVSIENNHARIDGSKCVSCGICQKVCPYHAIVYVPVPCEEACPVGAISKNEAGKQFIDYAKCIFCGKCTKSCPFGAVEEKSQIVEVIRLLKGERQTVAMVAPAIAGQFPGKISQIVAALKLLGFDQVVEVALGADITAKNEAAEFEERMQAGEPMMGTSCCPAYVEGVKKHVPDFIRYVSHTKTPMIYTAQLVKEKFPEAAAIFIGPCIAKKHEGFSSDLIDNVVTFEELGAMFIAKGINVATCEEAVFDIEAAGKEGRGFSVSTGVSAAVKAFASSVAEVRPAVLNGLDKKSLLVLRAYANGKAPGNLIEVMSCEGGCIAGPGAVGNPKICLSRVEEYKAEAEKKGGE